MAASGSRCACARHSRLLRLDLAGEVRLDLPEQVLGAPGHVVGAEKVLALVSIAFGASVQPPVPPVDVQLAGARVPVDAPALLGVRGLPAQDAPLVRPQ